MGTISRKYRVSVWEMPKWNSHTSKEILQWCRENCGDQWIDWSYASWEFRFRYKKTYAHFLLRWK